jgi:hypothetical protein
MRVAVRVAQDRQVGVHAIDRVTDHVEVLSRMQRYVHAGKRANLFGPLSRAVDDDLGVDVAGVGTHTGDPAALGENIDDADPLDDPGAAHPRPLREREGQVGRVRLAVAGQPDRTDQVVDAHHWIVLEGLLRCEQFALHVERLGVGSGAPQLDHAILGARDRHSPALFVARRQPDLALEFGVQLRRVLHQSRGALRRPQLTDQPCGVPCCPTG